MANQGPLAGVRVVELADDTGRTAGKLFSELGADVAQVGRGIAGPPMAGPAGAAGGLLDWWWDGGKRRVGLDLERPEGREAFLRLLGGADILVETEAPGRLAALGLEHAALAARRPGLVHVSLTPFGADGPRAHWRSSDLVASALGGWLSVTGWPGRPVPMWGRQSAWWAAPTPGCPRWPACARPGPRDGAATSTCRCTRPSCRAPNTC